MKLKLGWNETSIGHTYKGEWLRLSVHNISGLGKEEWFLTCHALQLDHIKLRAHQLEKAKIEALTIAARMCSKYRTDIARARFTLPDPGLLPNKD